MEIYARPPVRLESSVLVFGCGFGYVLMVLCCCGYQTVGKDLP